MKIYQYRPSFFEGFDTEIYEVYSKEELFNTELCKRFSSDDDFTGFELPCDMRIVFAVYSDGERQGCCTVRTDEDHATLIRWFADEN